MKTKHALTVLTRLVARRPEKRILLTVALRHRTGSLGSAAIEMARETGEPIGRALSDLLVEEKDHSAWQALLADIPIETLSLRELALTLTCPSSKPHSPHEP